MNALEKLTDFNDLAATRGQDAVAQSVAAACPPDLAAMDISDWPDPIMQGGSKAPPIPANLLPSWVGQMAAAVADSTQTPAAMSVMIALSVLATCLQRQFVVQPYHDDESYVEPLALWTLTAMPSGARKTAVIKLLAGPLQDWEKAQRDQLRRSIAAASAARAVAKKQIEKLIRDAANAEGERCAELHREIERLELAMPEETHPPRLYTGDVTAETLQGLLVKHGERMSVLTDEAGIFLVMAGLYSGGNASLDVFLQAHAGSSVRVDRADREAYLSSPTLSFGLALQPGILADVASTSRFRDSGLLARFLYAMPESTVGKRDVRRRLAMPVEVIAEYAKGIHALLRGRLLKPDDPARLPLSHDALECWLDFSEQIEHKIGDVGELNSIDDWASKLPGAVARIAGLLELAAGMGRADEVSVSSIVNAIALGELFIPHAQAAFGLLGADQADSDAMAIFKWVRANASPTFTRHSCQKAMEGRFRRVERLVKAADRLKERDILREWKEPVRRGVPPSVWYRMNPKCLST